MAAPRNAAPAPNLAPLVAGVAVVLGIGAAVFRLPGALVILIGLVVAGFLSTPPQLTGKKDAAGYPTVGNPGEQKKYDQHRMWTQLRWKLIVPNAHWLFNDPRTVRDWKQRGEQLAQKSPLLGKVPAVSVGLMCVAWLVVPAAFVTMAALALAFSVYTLPVDRLAMWGLHDTASWLMWPNAVAAYLLIQQTFAIRRQFAAPQDPQPAVGMDGLAVAIGRKGIHPLAVTAATVGAAAVGGVGVGTAILATDIDWLIYPWPVTATGAALAAAAFTLRAFALPDALDDWRNLVDARAAWTPRWESLKTTPEPYLISHTRHQVSDQAPPVIAETFDAPAAIGAAGIVALGQKGSLTTVLGGGSQVYVVGEPDIDSQGQPIPGTRAPLRCTIVSWPTDATLDLTGRDVDMDAFEILLRAIASVGSTSDGMLQPLMLDKIELISAADDEHPGAVWATSWLMPDGSDISAVGGMVGHVQNLLGVDAVPDPAQGLLYVGAIHDEQTKYLDAGMTTHLMRLERASEWSTRWRDALPMNTQHPHIQHDVYQELRSAGGQTVYVQPFMTNLGENLIKHYINTEIETQLPSTLGYATFVSIQHYPQPGARPGTRHPGALQVAWSNDPLPSSPAKLKPSLGRGNDMVSRTLLQHMIDVGFDAARLPRPEIVTATNLTSARSDEHIWDVHVRLYGAATLAEVKKKIEVIRNAMGAPPWIRVTGAEDGCRIVAGASPHSELVAFSRRPNRNICTALDWEQAFTDAKITGPNGEAPVLVDVTPMPKNEKVEKLTFKMPPGVDKGAVRAARSKLKPATGNTYLEDEDGPTPDTVTLVACPEEPVPFPAPFDWEAIAESKAIPFASGVTGEPIEYDWKLDVHALVLGGSGTGKSALLQNLITGALIRGCDVYVADPTKGAADFQYADPWVKAMPVTDLETSAMMDHIYKQEIVPRKNLNSQYGVASYTDLPEDVRPPHIVVVIDEFTSLMFTDKLDKLPQNATEEEQLAHREAELANQARRNIGAMAGRIVREARSAGVTLILAAQELKSDTISKIPGGGSLKNNMSSILLGKSTFGSRQSALKDPLAAPELGDGVPRGRGLFESSASSAQVIQSWYDAPDHLGSMVAHISEVRTPLDPSEKPDLASKVKKVEEGPVFGRVIDDGAADAGSDEDADGETFELVDDGTDEEIDMGEIDLGLADLFATEDPAEQPAGGVEITPDLHAAGDDERGDTGAEIHTESGSVTESSSESVSEPDLAPERLPAPMPEPLPAGPDGIDAGMFDAPAPLPLPVAEEPEELPAPAVVVEEPAAPAQPQWTPTEIPAPEFDDDMFGAPLRHVSDEERF